MATQRSRGGHLALGRGHYSNAVARIQADSKMGNMEVRTAGAIVRRGNQVLLLAATGTKSGRYELPSGHCEEGESERECAARELLEETGLCCEAARMLEIPVQYRAVIDRGRGAGPEQMVMSTFVVTEFQGTPVSTGDGEPVWVEVEEALRLPLINNVERMLRDMLELERERSLP